MPDRGAAVVDRRVRGMQATRHQSDHRPDHSRWPSRAVDPKAVATLIVASLEGALMISRIQRNDEALRQVQSHLYSYLKCEVAAS